MINSMFNRDWTLEPIQSTKWNPAVDVKETDSSFLISADIPGLTKKDINMISDDVLSTAGRGQKIRWRIQIFITTEKDKRIFTRSFHLRVCR